MKAGGPTTPAGTWPPTCRACSRVSRATALGARELRKESRGGHTREDFPNADPEYAKFNFAHSIADGDWDSAITSTERRRSW